MPLSYAAPRALIIDDDQMSRELLTVFLEAEGYRVNSADSGEAALTHLATQLQGSYDIILTDLQMPGTAGAELARELRRSCGADPILLAMSGSQPRATDIVSYDGFLLKPFPIEAIAAALSNRAAQTIRPIDAGAITVPRPLKSEVKTDGSPGQSHQSRRLPVTPDVLSIAASVANEASNLPMVIPTEEQELQTQKQQLADPAMGTRVPALNEEIYQQLAAAMPLTQLQEMYRLCINDARKRIAGMRASITERDGAQFVREAHSIKGGSGMLGASELHRLAAALETSGLSSEQQGSPRDVNSLDELCAACDRLERMLGSRV